MSDGPMATPEIQPLRSPVRPADAGGRTALGARTRVRITDALLSLLVESGGTPPTAQDVATEALVSLRLVFYHFSEMENLYDVAAAALIARHYPSQNPVDAEKLLAERVDGTVRRRSALHEDLLPLRRAARTLTPSSGRLVARLADLDAALRRALAVTFAWELAAQRTSATGLLETLDAASSWEMWDRLRGPQSLGVRRARSVMAATVSAILRGPGAATPHGRRHTGAPGRSRA